MSPVKGSISLRRVNPKPLTALNPKPYSYCVHGPPSRGRPHTCFRGWRKSCTAWDPQSTLIFIVGATIGRLGIPVVPFYPFIFGGLLIKLEHQENGYPYHYGVTGEPRWCKISSTHSCSGETIDFEAAASSVKRRASAPLPR